MKGLPSLAVLGALCAIPAHAGPYLSVEANSGWIGSDYVGNTTETALGYELTTDALTFYGQAGPPSSRRRTAKQPWNLPGKSGPLWPRQTTSPFTRSWPASLETMTTPMPESWA